MPRGPTPKPEGQAVTRHRPTIEQVELGTAPAHVDAPPIPKRQWSKLHKATRAWWKTWLSAPQASQFVGTDWNRLHMVLLPLVEAFNQAADAGDVDRMVKLESSIWRHEKEFGATPESRIRNRWVVRRAGQTSGDDAQDETESKRRPRKVERDPRRLQIVKGG